MNRVRYNHNRTQRLPDKTKLVTRRTRWGNLFKLKEHGGQYTRESALRLYVIWLDGQLINNSQFLEPLYGYNLACYCPLSKECHADIILKKIEAIQSEKRLNKWLE